MELYHELLFQYLINSSCEVRFPDINLNADDIVHTQCYKALQKIKEIIDDDSLNDKECFHKIENIIQVLESVGVSCGDRHDFG